MTQTAENYEWDFERFEKNKAFRSLNHCFHGCGYKWGYRFDTDTGYCPNCGIKHCTSRMTNPDYDREKMIARLDEERRNNERLD